MRELFEEMDDAKKQKLKIDFNTDKNIELAKRW